MEKIYKQELFAAIQELRAPLHSAENWRPQNMNTESSNSIPISVHDTEEKRPISEGDTAATDSTDKKFTFPSGSEDSDSDTEPVFSIRDKLDLMKQIEKLQKEQEELRHKQQIHEQHIKELLTQEPYVNQHFKALGSNFSGRNPKMVTQFNGAMPLSTSSYGKRRPLLMEEQHLYVQLEQLYANFHVLRFPSKTPQFPLGSQKGNTYIDVPSMEEVQSLKNKIKELERKLSYTTQKSLPPPPHYGSALKPAKSEGRLEEIGSPYSSMIKGVSGRPICPVPVPQMPADLFPVEVTFKWIISNYSRKLRQEKLSEGQKEVSWPFYLSHCGYRAQAEVYLNGNGTGTNRCMSVFLRIVKGDYDRHLKWPVNLHFVVILVNQSGDHTDSLKAEGSQFQYSKPWGSSDGESDCWGLIEFVSHDMIKQRNYILDDKIVLKCRMHLL
ncbi:hypothetical protein BsWGS_27331 [Bradybaena similaris]